MKNTELKVTKDKGIRLCRNVLENSNYEIENINFQKGIIYARKNENLLSYGNKIIIEIKTKPKTIEIFVQSNSIGIQVIDWGINSSYEKEIIELINEMSI